jgi:hypothetical protein
MKTIAARRRMGVGLGYLLLFASWHDVARAADDVHPTIAVRGGVLVPLGRLHDDLGASSVASPGPSIEGEVGARIRFLTPFAFAHYANLGRGDINQSSGSRTHTEAVGLGLRAHLGPTHLELGLGYRWLSYDLSGLPIYFDPEIQGYPPPRGVESVRGPEVRAGAGGTIPIARDWFVEPGVALGLGKFDQLTKSNCSPCSLKGADAVHTFVVIAVGIRWTAE